MESLKEEFEELFLEYARTQAALFERGLDKKEARKRNREADKATENVKKRYIEIRNTDQIKEIEIFLTHENPYVRLIAATYSFGYNAKMAEETLKNLVNMHTPGLYRFNAQVSLDMWQKGHLPRKRVGQLKKGWLKIGRKNMREKVLILLTKYADAQRMLFDEKIEESKSEKYIRLSNSASKELHKIYTTAQEANQQEILNEFMHHENKHIRFMAANLGFKSNPELATKTLKDLMLLPGPDMVRAHASNSLDAWMRWVSKQ